MMSELKSCPFCGGKAKYVYEMPYSYVYCTKCDSIGKAVIDTYEQEDGRLEAEKAWNRREGERKHINNLAEYLMYEAQAESSYASDDIKDWEKVAKMMMGERDNG